MKVLKFIPQLKQTIWGGERIIPFKGLESSLHHVGESWEISAVKGSETVVASGPYQGRTLSSLVMEMGVSLVGKDCYEKYGTSFPLLVKLIDANSDLSIQVHPDDVTAHRHGYESGKTEMWYMMESAPKAKIRLGLKHRITFEDYKRLVEEDKICEVIAEHDVHEGDCFYLSPGRIHSIGAGCFLVEIQQSSDVTYRIYDFKRRDKNGCLRELHTDLAAEAIDYHVDDDYKRDYVIGEDGKALLVKCPLFTTFLYDVKERVCLDYSHADHFVILVCVKGEGVLVDDEGDTLEMKVGDTLLVPATMKKLEIRGRLRFLETYP